MQKKKKAWKVHPLEINCSNCQHILSPKYNKNIIDFGRGHLTFVGIDNDTYELLIAGKCPICQTVTETSISLMEIVLNLPISLQNKILEGLLLTINRDRKN